MSEDFGSPSPGLRNSPKGISEVVDIADIAKIYNKIGAVVFRLEKLRDEIWHEYVVSGMYRYFVEDLERAEELLQDALDLIWGLYWGNEH
jgi:hypothetical protein